MLYGGIFDLDNKINQIELLSKQQEDPATWTDRALSQKIGKEKRMLETIVADANYLKNHLRDNQELFDLVSIEGDSATLKTIQEDIDKLEKKVDDIEFKRMFSNPMDSNNCFIDFQSGSGGTEAQDWANMLLRMYIRYAERKNFKVEVMELSEGEVAGIKGATLKVLGEYAFGYFRTETGIHRLVRKSPFDSGSRRHTSFAGVNVYPEIDESIEIDINPSDLRIDTYRASGAGGQHINKTDSAVRITHLPSGLVVECQDDRSQHRNKAQAMSILAAKIKDNQIQEQQLKIASERKSLIGSGDRSERIRTYNFPQGRITDHRINLTLYKIDFIMDGDLNELIEALNSEHQADLLAQLDED